MVGVSESSPCKGSGAGKLTMASGHLHSASFPPDTVEREVYRLMFWGGGGSIS